MDEKRQVSEAAEDAPVQTPVNGSEPAASDAVDVADSTALLEAVTAERDRLASERAELYDRLLRRTAEFDNYRRRVERERTELSEYAGMEIVRELLPIVDDFERALAVESADKEYAKGMALIHQRLLETLKKAGLEPIEAAGQTFDPYVHHAVEMAATEEADDNTVLEEYRRGYNFKGRLLRPAMVKVAVNRAKPE